MNRRVLISIALLCTVLFPNTVLGQTLAYSTFLGGSKDDGGRVYVTTHAGSVIVASSTSSTNFPVTLPSTSGSSQISVTKLDPDGNGSNDLVWSLKFGGSSSERMRVSRAQSSATGGHSCASVNRPVRPGFSGRWADVSKSSSDRPET